MGFLASTFAAFFFGVVLGLSLADVGLLCFFVFSVGFIFTTSFLKKYSPLSFLGKKKVRINGIVEEGKKTKTS